MTETARKYWTLLVSGALTLALAAPVLAMDCRTEYDRKIHHINTKLEQERWEVRKDRDRLERAYREHRGSRERKAELRREYEREKEKLRRMERHMREQRAQAKRELRECQERGRSYRR